MAKAKDYSGVPAMSGRLDTAFGEVGQHVPKLAPEVWGKTAEEVGGLPAAGQATHSVLQDPTAQEVLQHPFKEGGDPDLGGAPMPEGAAGTNHVVSFESNDEPNPIVPPNAEAAVGADGEFVTLTEPAPGPAGGTTDKVADATAEGIAASDTPVGVPTGTLTEKTAVDAGTATEPVGEPTGEDEAGVPEPTDEQVAAVDAEGNADHVKGLVVARGFAEPKTKGEANVIEATARLLEAKHNDELLALLPNGGEGHKSATKAELIVLILTADDTPS